MIPYILHTAILLSGSYLFYRYALTKETFFRFNRWVLMTCLALSFVLPTIIIPGPWSVWQAPPILSKTMVPNPILSNEEIETSAIAKTNSQALESELNVTPNHISSDLSNKMRSNSDQRLDGDSGGELSISPIIEENTEPTVAEGQKESLIPHTVSLAWWRGFNYQLLLSYIYMAGILIFSLNLIIQFSILIYQMIRRPSIIDGRFRIIELKGDYAPFSFANCIFINPEKYDPETFQQVLKHEKVHISQAHTLDIILTELVVIFQWFNPFAWKFRKAVENNLEYLTDNEMINRGTDKESYQMSLLKVSVPHHSLNLATNYNQSFLKKRILMMNAKKSSASSSWKYLLILPLFALSMVTMNAFEDSERDLSHFTINEDNSNKKLSNNNQIRAEKNKEEKASQKDFKTIKNPSEKPSEFIEKKENEFPAVSKQEMLEVSGVWNAEIRDNKVCITYIKRKNGSVNMNTHCFERNELGNLPGNQEGTFSVKGEAGTLEMKGSFSGNEGKGTYTFNEDSSFRSYLNQEGLGDVKEETLLHFVLTKIGKDYISYLKRENYELSDKALRRLAIHGLTLDLMKEYSTTLKRYGYDDPEVDEIVKMKIHRVSPKYFDELSALGFQGLSIDKVVSSKIHRVSADYIRGLKEAGFGDLTMDQVIKFSIHKVDLDYVKGMSEAGYSGIAAEKILRARIHKVSPAFIQDLKSMGYNDFTMQEITQFSIHKVSADFIRKLGEYGYKDLSAREIQQAKIHKVNPELIKTLNDAGFSKMSIRDITQFSIHKVTPEYVKGLADAGYTNLSAKEIQQAKIHKVDGDFAQGFKDLGFSDLSMNRLVNLKIHKVTPEYIKKLNDAGVKGLDIDDYKKMKMHGTGDKIIEKNRNK